jgi:hypothetical protein
MESRERPTVHGYDPLGIHASFGANPLAETDSWRVRARHRSGEMASDSMPFNARGRAPRRLCRR